jgi:3-oxoadipate enol-lactonase
MTWIGGLLGALAGWRLLGPELTPRFPPGQEHPWRIPGRTVFVGDREFLVRETGPIDGPPVMLIHGLGGSSLAEWYKIAPFLGEQNRVIMVDHRSHGLSAQDRQRFEVAEEADDMAAVLDAIGLTKVVAVGYSMGGALAQALAHRHPHRVSGLVLIGTFVFHPPAWRRARVTGILITRAWERLTGLGAPEVRSGYLRAVGAVEPQHARWLWEETQRRDPDAGAAAGLALMRFDSRDWVGRLNQPALVIIPIRDQLVPPAWQYQLASRLKKVRVVELEGAKHEAPWTHAYRITEEISRFLDEVSDGVAGEVAPDQKTQAQQNHQEKKLLHQARS